MHKTYCASPSSRRAWIEIQLRCAAPALRVVVALLAEGVDRNKNSAEFSTTISRSPSSRRAWIEIAAWRIINSNGIVALLAEGVDRNS